MGSAYGSEFNAFIASLSRWKLFAMFIVFIKLIKDKFKLSRSIYYLPHRQYRDKEQMAVTTCWTGSLFWLLALHEIQWSWQKMLAVRRGFYFNGFEILVLFNFMTATIDIPTIE